MDEGNIPTSRNAASAVNTELVGGVRTLGSADLFAGSREVIIVHEGERYRPALYQQREAHTDEIRTTAAVSRQGGGLSRPPNAPVRKTIDQQSQPATHGPTPKAASPDSKTKGEGEQMAGRSLRLGITGAATTIGLVFGAAAQGARGEEAEVAQAGAGSGRRGVGYRRQHVP